MEPSTNGHAGNTNGSGTGGRPAHEHDSLDTVPTGWRDSLPRYIGFTVFVLLTAFWIWAFANRDSIDHPDQFDDPAFIQAAEAICAPRQANIAEIPLATAAENPVERGELLERGTDQLELMVGELRALALPTDPEGAESFPQWLDDFDLFLNDRRVYADILATGDDPAFLISGNAQGVRVTDLLTTYAEVNQMNSCAPSGDI